MCRLFVPNNSSLSLLYKQAILTQIIIKTQRVKMKNFIAVSVVVLMGLLVKDCDGIRLANSPFAEDGVLGDQHLAQVDTDAF